MQQSFNQGVVRRACSFAVLALLAFPAWAGPGEPEAGQDGTVPPAAQQDAKPAAVAPSRSGLGLDFGPAADLGKLEQARGGTDAKTDVKLDGVVTGNSATNVSTGGNVIDSGAFSNMSGIPVVIQNSGANVLIQSSTVINVQFK
ncbi:hypothetical protein AB595_11815 [Massilia sp. WF1]|uniref:hypothetical protein n=1 Tax=unclassified Massilia TaxID=2609279 RepID=UPI000649792B|nr:MULTISPECIES: hypothetical protein [unclassified Massilia]ALK97298.1 hypothetical protein AM586_14700 [Massilia sp. WG5]KLU36478.1 hypothetical protein AB595_11815 [Massilia sp. WF1]